VSLGPAVAELAAEVDADGLLAAADPGAERP
jgi:hypothetical protein